MYHPFCRKSSLFRLLLSHIVFIAFVDKVTYSQYNKYVIKSKRKRGNIMQIRSTFEKYNIEYYGFEFTVENPIDTYYCLQSPDIGHISDLHYHNALEIGFCYSGSGIFIINDEVIPFKAPCAVIIYENQLHKAQSNPQEESKWVFISLNPTLLLADVNPQKTAAILTNKDRFTGKAGIIHHSDDPELVDLIYDIIHEIEIKKDGYLDSIRGLFWSAMVKHNRIMEDLYHDEETSHRKKRILHEIGMTINYISANYKKNITIEELVQFSNFSEASLRRKFNEALGFSPIDYLHKVRMNTASALLLNSSLPVIEICYLAGYESQSCFNRQFKQCFGMSPRQWKNTN